MAKHKAPTEITIAQEERSAFAEFVDQYKWMGVGALVVVSGLILWMSRASAAKVEGKRADWEKLYVAEGADDRAEAFLTAALEVESPQVAAIANVNRAVALVQDREYGDAEAAIGKAMVNAPDLFSTVTFPVGKDGSEEPLLKHLQTSIQTESVWMDAHKSLFENEPLPAGAPKVELTTNLGPIVIGLYVEKAPKHAKNFMERVRTGYYDGTRFHRVQKGNFIQGGDPNSRDDDPTQWGLGGPEETITPEKSGLVHAAGVLAAAKKQGDPNSSGSQFYITAGPMHGFDGNYVVYGTVVEGLEIVEEISNAELRDDKPETPQELVTIVTAKILE